MALSVKVMIIYFFSFEINYNAYENKYVSQYSAFSR